MKYLFVLLTLFASTFSVSAQKSKGNQKSDTSTAVTQTSYTCAMHPEVTSDKPGKCTKCGMDLTQSKKEQMKMEVMKTYYCPMHPDVKSNKPGTCAKCGMDLVEKKASKKKKRKA